MRASMRMCARVCFAPTSSAEDEKVEQFYDDTERTMADSDSKYKMITGDFNAKIKKKKASRAWEHLE